ncbi:MAG: hypothetical protein DI604_28090 [Delftia acidovorans]|nr:MAG: hypothetical protein DI604_28090 [Delftia acidovorans]
MNKERILALANLIEKQPHSAVEEVSGFNMVSYVHACGTPACIAGWAVASEGTPSPLAHQPIQPTGVSSRAAKYLGLEYPEAEELFLGGVYDLDEITPAQAAACLRHLAETGEVDWDHAMGVAA